MLWQEEAVRVRVHSKTCLRYSRHAGSGQAVLMGEKQEEGSRNKEEGREGRERRGGLKQRREQSESF